MSGPGADDGEERARALPTSSADRGGHSLNARRMVSTKSAGSPGKDWSRRARFSSGEVEVPGSSGKRGGRRPTASFLAVNTDWGVTGAKKEDQ